MRNKAVEVVREFNKASDFNLDIMFWEENEEVCAQLFDRFNNSGTNYDKFVATIEEPNSPENIRQSAEKLVDSIRNNDMNPDQEHKTSGELSDRKI